VGKNYSYRRNLLKEYLQIVALDFIYSHPRYSQLFFYGGSCLAQCYGLPRLSEDLDFVDVKKEISLDELSADLKAFFSRTDLEVKIARQKFRLHLKFPLLKEFGLARAEQSDLLFLKIEIFSNFNFCTRYQTEFLPLFKFNRSILIRTFDLPTLMSTKIRAIFHRKWEKTDKSGQVLASVKGRDYFDLLWYLDRGVKPNIDCLEGVKNLDELRERLLKQIKNIDARSIRLDLSAFIDDENFVKNLSAQIKKILEQSVNKNLA
jgi:predicted nucleotidyltransferase component of viral defense system